jgi:hypothetical protein
MWNLWNLKLNQNTLKPVVKPFWTQQAWAAQFQEFFLVFLAHPNTKRIVFVFKATAKDLGQFSYMGSSVSSLDKIILIGGEPEVKH